MTTHHRSARARVQVLLILCVLLLLAGLILTAIVRIRQTAAQMSCQNNLKQLGIGLHAYTDSNGRLPPLVDQGEGSPTGRGLPSVLWTLIPFLEATHREYRPEQARSEAYHAPTSTLFAFRWKTGESASQDGGDGNQVYKMFLCPSDTTPDQLRDVPLSLPDGTTGHYATGSYVANGMLPWNQKGFALSPNTILFAERPQVCRTAEGDMIYNLWGVGFYSPHMPAFATRTPADPPGLGVTGHVLPESSEIITPVQHHRAGRSSDPRLPGALHPDGMCVGMGDGSVRVFRYDTPASVFWAACQPK